MTAGSGPVAAGEIRGHRRVTPFGRLGSGLLAAVLVLAVLLIGGALKALVPDTAREQEPFARTGAVGSTVVGRTFTATVLGVRGGAILADDGQNHDTGGVWLLVSVKLTATQAPISMGYAALRDSRGRTYRATDRIEQFLVGGGRLLQPHIPVTGEVAFEVPAGVAAQLSLLLAVRSDGDERLDTMAVIRLGIDAARVPQWQADKQPLTVAPAVSS